MGKKRKRNQVKKRKKNGGKKRQKAKPEQVEVAIAESVEPSMVEEFPRSRKILAKEPPLSLGWPLILGLIAMVLSSITGIVLMSNDKDELGIWFIVGSLALPVVFVGLGVLSALFFLLFGKGSTSSGYDVSSDSDVFDDYFDSDSVSDIHEDLGDW